jgi:hypothetical protein
VGVGYRVGFCADYQRQCGDERDAHDAPARISERCAHVVARRIAARAIDIDTVV